MISSIVGGLKTPGLIGRTFFTADFKSAGTPSGIKILNFQSERFAMIPTKI